MIMMTMMIFGEHMEKNSGLTFGLTSDLSITMMLPHDPDSLLDLATVSKSVLLALL